MSCWGPPWDLRRYSGISTGQVGRCEAFVTSEALYWPSTGPLEIEYKMPMTHLHFQCDTQVQGPQPVFHIRPSGSSEVLGLRGEHRVKVSLQSVKIGMRTLSWGQSPTCTGAGWLPISGRCKCLHSRTRPSVLWNSICFCYRGSNMWCVL